MTAADARTDDAGRKDRRLSLRVDSRQRELIRLGAEARHQSVTEFVLQSACASAEHALADRRRFVLDDDRWAAFTAALERPVADKPRLRALLAQPSVFDHDDD